MTSTSRTGSKPPPPPPPPPEKTKKSGNKGDKGDDTTTDQDNLNAAIGAFSIMMLQKIMQDAKQRRAEINEDDPDAF